MIKPSHLINEIIVPVLNDLDRAKPGIGATSPAVMLMLGTAAQESDLGFFLRQHPSGPARGVWQMEAATVADLIGRYLHKDGNEELRQIVMSYWSGTHPIEEEITWNLKLACALARVRYWMVPIPLPVDLEGQARYWDVHYNANDEDEVEEYIASYNEFVMSNYL